MVSLRPAAVIGTLCVSVALLGAPAATAQVPHDTGPRVVVTDLPVLSELPPLPTEGDTQEVDEEEDGVLFGLSGVQTVAFVLAAGALVAGGTGLALVTRRGRGDHSDARSGHTGPVA